MNTKYALIEYNANGRDYQVIEEYETLIAADDHYKRIIKEDYRKKFYMRIFYRRYNEWNHISYETSLLKYHNTEANHACD
jgi:hypothetical protein